MTMATAFSLRPVTLTLPAKVIESLDRIAEAEDRSRSSVVRRLIESAFDSGLNATPAGVDVQAGAMENKPTPQPDPFYRFTTTTPTGEKR